jgi:sugar lactone lactonase YvrE
MRLTVLRAIALGLAISLSGCLARPAAMIPAGAEAARSASLSVRPVSADGMRLLATPPDKTAANIDRVEIFLQIKHEGAYMPLDAGTGLPSATTETPVMKRVDGPLASVGTLTFTNLKPNSEYRVLARGYEGGVLLTDDERSSTVIQVGLAENLGAVTVPLTIVTPFGAETEVSLSLWGATLRIERVKAILSSPAQGVVAQVEVPLADLSKALKLASLRANTTYTLDLQALAAGSATAIATASALIPVTNDETVATRSIPLSIKGDMKLPLESYSSVSVDLAGNVYASVSRYKDGVYQRAADIFRFTPTGGSSKVYVPHRVDFLKVSGNGTRFVNGDGTVNYRPLRIVSEAGDEEVVGSTAMAVLNAMAADAQGNLFVSSGNAVRKVTPDGTETLVANTIKFPDDLAVASDGTLYVTSSYNASGATGSTVWRISPKANPAEGYEAPVLLCDDFQAQYFNDIAADSKGNVYVIVNPTYVPETKTYLMGFVHQISPDGTRTEIQPNAYGPRGLAVDAHDNVYLTELSGGRITVF